MATGTRIRQDFIEGTLISNLSTSATAMESDGLADLAVIDNAANGDYAALVIGDEVVHVIVHNSAATTGEIERGQDGTSATEHDAGAPWHHGPTEFDHEAVGHVTKTADYILALRDAGNVVEMNVGSANNLTVPANSSVAFPIGTIIEIHQYGAGQTTVVAASGVTINSPNGLNLRAQYSSATLRKRGTDEWILSGDTTT